MKSWIVILMLLGGCAPSVWAGKCFFESDCTKDETCVTPKGSAFGVCQPKAAVTIQKDNPLGSESIINQQGKCTFYTDCPNGGQCIKQPGALHGTCQGSGYTAGNISAERAGVYKDKSCFFNQDCRVGEVCVKPQGSFKGVCQDDFYQTKRDPIKDAKDPRALLQTMHTSDRQCLVDTDCSLTEVCLKQERSVFGVCRLKSAIPTTNTPDSTSGVLSNPNSLFNE